MTTYSFIDESGETRLVGTISPAPGGGSQTITSPLGITGCVGWWDASQLVLADDATVALLPDLSTSGYDFAQATTANRPVCKTAIQNGLRVVRFDGSDVDHPQFLALSGAGLGLFRNLAGVTIGGVAGNIVGGNDYLLEATSGTNVAKTRAVWETPVNMGVTDDDGGNAHGLSASPPDSGSRRTVGILAADLVTALQAVQGSPTTQDTAGVYTAVGQATADTDSLAIWLGAIPPDGSNGAASADFCELAVYNRALDPNERRQLLDYLAAKWATL